MSIQAEWTALMIISLVPVTKEMSIQAEWTGLMIISLVPVVVVLAIVLVAFATAQRCRIGMSDNSQLPTLLTLQVSAEFTCPPMNCANEQSE